MEDVPLNPSKTTEKSKKEVDPNKKKELAKFIAKAEERPERQKAPEASQLHGASHEHIGHMLVTAESADQPARREKPEKMNVQLREKNIETLNRAELLAISEKIIVDGTSLRQIYDTHLIGERGLRRLVIEYLRSGDLKEALRREVIEREIDFERDPALRDMAPQVIPVPSSGGKAGKATLDELLEHASAGMGDSSEGAAFFKARAAYEESNLQQQQTKRRLVDISVVAIITILIVLIIILLLTRH